MWRKISREVCRKRRVKGRDFYDFVWYLGKGIPAHLAHLRQRMEQSGHWERGRPLDEADLKALLRRRFEEVDFEQAKSGVLPFLRDA